jgi:hypothetical protein
VIPNIIVPDRRGNKDVRHKVTLCGSLRHSGGTVMFIMNPLITPYLQLFSSIIVALPVAPMFAQCVHKYTFQIMVH